MSDTDDAALEVGWLGLGAMGTPMARVAATTGHHVTAYDLDRPAPATSPTREWRCGEPRRGDDRGRRAGAEPRWQRGAWSSPRTAGLTSVTCPASAPLW